MKPVGIIFVAVVVLLTGTQLLPAQVVPASATRYEPASGARLEPTTTSPAAAENFRKAVWHWGHAFQARALSHLDQALTLDPQFGLARVIRGGLKPGLTQEERQAEMSKGIAALSNAPAGELAVALAWRETWSGRGPNSAALMAAAAQLLPGDGQVGWWNYTRQQAAIAPEQRIPSGRAFIARYPEFSVAYRQVSYLMFRTGDQPGALSLMRDYVRLDPNHPNTHASMGELYHFAAQNEDATREFNKALEVDSTWAGLAYLADIRLVAGDIRGARRIWDQAIARSLAGVDSMDHAHTLALVTYLEGDAAGSLRRMNELAAQAEARRFTPQATLLHQRMALLEALNGSAAATEDHLAKAAKLGGDNTAAQHAHASLSYAALKQFDRARSSADKFSAVAVWPVTVFRHTLEGFIALQSGDPGAAADHLKQSEPIDVLSKELLAEARQAQRNVTEAQALRQEVLRSSTMVYGSHLMDVYAVMAKSRARRTS